MTKSKLAYDVKTYGNEGESVVIIDNFSDDYDALLQTGQTCRYTPKSKFYPGVQSQANGHYLAPRGEMLLGIMREVFNNPNGMNLESCVYSLVSKPTEALNPMQRIPHFDSQDNKLFALLHYMQGPIDSGTAFYRHKSTGFETITPERAQAYQTALDADMEKSGGPEQGYICGDTPAFELLLKIDAQPNRAILYRGNTLHSGIIPKTMPLTTDPLKARMTLNAFIWAV